MFRPRALAALIALLPVATPSAAISPNYMAIEKMAPPPGPPDPR
jgi:hypothetical protein